MCHHLAATRSRKRPRSHSTTTTNGTSDNVHRITPERQQIHIDDGSSSDGGRSSNRSCTEEEEESDYSSSCAAESDHWESEPEAETSFESPVSSSSSQSSDSPVTSYKRAKRSHTYTLNEEDSVAAAMRVPPPTTATTTTTVTTAGDKASRTALSAHRDEIVAAILTITSALGLTKETLHVCVDLLDRYLQHVQVSVAHLEKLSIACLWIAVKFIETPETIAKKSIKPILKRRRHSGNWTWYEILAQEAEILRVLKFRVISSTVLNVLQTKIHTTNTTIATGESLSKEQIQLAYYFADLLLLKDRMNKFPKELLVDAIWFVSSGQQIADVQAPLLAPVVILFLAHRDNINHDHPVYKTWFALRCQYGPFLQAPWQLPFDPKCECRVCEHTLEERQGTTIQDTIDT